MQGFRQERDFGALFEGGAVALDKSPGAPIVPRAAGVLSPPHAERRPLQSAKRMLDGVGGLGWSVIGFAAGAVFWHFVGFWSFMSDVVLAEAAPSVVAADKPAAHAHLRAPRTRWLQVADVSELPCTSLSLDRQTGVTSARPCQGDHALLPSDSFQGREDRIVTGTLADSAPVQADD